MSDDAIATVAQMINTSGANRSQRRRLEKSLNRVETIRAHAQKHLDDKAYKEYAHAVDTNFCHFFAILAIVADEDYKFKEDATHNQISSLLERVGKKLDKYANMGYSTDDLLKLVEERYDMILVPKED